MNITVLLLFKYGLFTVVLKVSGDTRYLDLHEFVNVMWRNLKDAQIRLSYSISGNSKCILDSDEDFMNMLSLSYSFKPDYIEVGVVEDTRISLNSEVLDANHLNDVQSNNKLIEH